MVLVRILGEKSTFWGKEELETSVKRASCGNEKNQNKISQMPPVKIINYCRSVRYTKPTTDWPMTPLSSIYTHI